MSARREKTKTPGIFKRGDRYVFSYRVEGKQRWELARTLDEARRARAARTTDIRRGEFQEHSRVRCANTARHGWSATWAEVVAASAMDARRIPPPARPVHVSLLQVGELTEITSSRVAGFGWLCDEGEQGRALSDATVRNIMAPLRACLATAVARA